MYKHFKNVTAPYYGDNATSMIPPDTFNNLFEMYWKIVYNAARGHLKNHDDAMDIVQDLFIHIWQAGPIGRVRNIQAYLLVAVRNKTRKVQSRQNKHLALSEEHINIESPLHPDRHIRSMEVARRYEALLNNLPAQRRTIFRLRYHEDMSTECIAEHLNISRKTVQNQLSLSSDYIKTYLAEH